MSCVTEQPMAFQHPLFHCLFQGRPCHVFVDANLGMLIWSFHDEENGVAPESPVKSMRLSFKTIFGAELLSVNQEERKNGTLISRTHAKKKSWGGSFSLELQDMSSQVQLGAVSIYSVVQADALKLRLKTHLFTELTNSGELVKLVHHCIHQFNPQRPNSLLVFVNPNSGKGQGIKIYESLVRPLLDKSLVAARWIITERQNHARDFILHEDVDMYDGILCVGGDGMLSEIVHGVLLRKRRLAGKTEHNFNSVEEPAHQPVGVIPAGSTDTVAYSVNGTSDGETCVLHCLTGHQITMDLISVFDYEGIFQRYNLSLLGYGFFGEVCRDSEPLRWMGPSRYDLIGAKTLLTLSSYPLEVQYLPAGDLREPSRVCHRQCTVCATCSDACKDHAKLTASQEQDPDTACSSDKLLAQSAQVDGWVTVRGDFVAVNNFLIPCRSRKTPQGMVPCLHLGDGCSDLVLVKDCSKRQFLEHLYRCSTTDPNSPVERQFSMDSVEVHRIKAFRCRPTDPEPASCWNCDGEVMSATSIQTKVNRQLLKIFGGHIPVSSSGNPPETDEAHFSVCTRALQTCTQCHRVRNTNQLMLEHDHSLPAVGTIFCGFCDKR